MLDGPLRTCIAGAGHCLGSLRAPSRDTALGLGLAEDWLLSRTGIEQRAICAPDENALSLAASAVDAALEQAELKRGLLGAESTLVYIHNSLEQGCPPAGIRLCALLGLRHVRALSLEGVCAEPIQALQLADAMLSGGLCQRVILVASVNYAPLINPHDPASAGLFGAGAGALILERSADKGRLGLRASSWHSDSNLAGLGHLETNTFEHQAEDLLVRASFYQMDGDELARQVLRQVPAHFERALASVSWIAASLDVVIAHQPNAKLLRLLGRRLGLREEQLPLSCRDIGNLGPASLLTGLSLWLQTRPSGPQRLLLLGFGLGFCCGTAAFESA